MDILAPVRAFDRVQRRHTALAIPVAVLKKFSDDQASNLAALITFYAFSSLFPLLLVFTAILGFVLQGDPAAQHAVVNSALKQIPIVGTKIGVSGGKLHGSGIGLAVGLVGSMLSGLGVTLAAQRAFNDIYAVPHRKRPDFLFSRLRGLGLIAIVGVLQIVSTALSGAVSGGLGGAWATIGGNLLALLINLVLFFAIFRVLTDRAVPTRELWPGVGMAAVLWTVLQALGGLYVEHVLKGADSTYGSFALVLGLIAWLFLGARVVVYSAELNTVLSRRLWPRSLLEPPAPADERTLEALAKVQERSDRERVEVAFEPPAEEHNP